MSIWLRTLLITLIVFGCSPEQEKNVEFGDLNIFLKTDTNIDSVFVSNFGQDKLFQLLPYSDTLLINSKNPINDLYNIYFFSGGKRRMNQFWLNGKNVIIQGRVNGNLQLEIDTVIASDLYYKSVDFRKQYREFNNKKDSAIINSFLLKSFQQHIDDPFSLEIASTFLKKNISNKRELRKLYELQVKQDTSILNHILSPFREIEKILLEMKVDFSKFEVYDFNDKATKINLQKGKRYLIDFWFVGCPPCVEDHKLISGNLELLKSRNIEVVGISIDKDREKWQKYLVTNEYNWTNYREVDDPEKAASKDLLIGVFPTYLMIDEKGEIVNRDFSVKEVLSYWSIQQEDKSKR